MAILMKLDNEIDKTKYYTDEEKAEMKKANKGKIVCPIMSPQMINMILKPKEVNTRKPLYELQELVCCENCKFIRWYEDEGYYYCALEDRPNRNWSVDETDFCSWGERESDTE